MGEALKIIALDLGTRTGWAWRGDEFGPVFSGVATFPTGRYEGGGMRFLRFQRWFDEALIDMQMVAFEEVRRHAATDAAHVYGGLLAVLTSSCERLKIPYTGIPVGTIKKHTTGKGNASKDQMIAAIRAQGYNPQDDNEADAIAILLCAEAGL